jgi:hypothetical protein
MAKTARLNSKRFRRPAARPICQLRYAKKVPSAYFSPAHCALRPAPHVIWYEQATACPRAAQKTQTYRSLRLPSVAALVPSAGAITTANRVAFGADAPRHPASGTCPHAARRAFRLIEGEIMEVRSILYEPSFTRLLQGAAAGAVVTMIVGFSWGGRFRPSPSARQGPTLPLTEA